MASQAGCEIMNSEAAGSILFLVKRRICKTQPLDNDESNTIIASHSNTVEVGGKIGCWVFHRGS